MGRKSILENRFIRPERLVWIAIGLFMILYDRPWDPHADVYSRGMRVSLSGRWLGAGFGLCVILGGLLYKLPKRYPEEGTICPKCQTPFGLERVKAPENGKCPDCNVDLEPIDGFYDRHPELKDKENEFPEDLMDDLK